MNETEPLSLGSLFDGIGGFVLAAQKVGIKPLWASEIEPHCIAITKHHFPEVTHLGDITKIDGGKIPVVDIITFGSPCQNLSISGNRKGLQGEQSGLFLEAIRIIKEMRLATNNQKPRYAIWENVMGALSSNDCEDFRQVLEEFMNTANTEAGGDENGKIKRIAKTGFIRLPKPPKWGNAGSIVGNSGEAPYSISWRILDSQYFGVPQRRKRIFLIADFGGGSSEEILFERESLSGDFGEMQTEKQGYAAHTQGSAEIANTDGITENNIADDNCVYQKTFSIVENIINRDLTSGSNGVGIAEDISYTLMTSKPHAVANCNLYNRSGFSAYKGNTVASTLVAHLGQEANDLVVNLGSQGDRIYCNAKKSVSLTSQGGGGGAKTGAYFLEDDFKKSKEIVSSTLNTDDLMATIENIIDKEGIEALLSQGYELHINGVRRLTPLECERLMGYEENWTNITITDKKGKPKNISDNARYRALGNSVVVNCVVFLLERLRNCHFNNGEEANEFKSL